MPKRILKKLILPIQLQFLKRGLCVGCTMPLSESENRSDRGDKTEKVICKCGRIYIYNISDKSYRRAKFNEI